MRIIEIKPLSNGAHRNQTGVFRKIPQGWALLPETIETENFPYGDIEVEEIGGVMMVISWVGREISVDAEHTPSPSALREQAYNTERLIDWNHRSLAVSEAAELWQFYAAEGSDKASELASLISKAKETIRKEYPDNDLL